MKRHCEKAQALKFLPYPIRENLPILGSRQHLGGQTKVLARCITADGALTWYVTEGSARRNPAGEAVDYLLYGLVEGQGRKLDYFWLSDLVTLRSPTGAAVLCDLRWQPKLLEEIAPELFKTNRKKVED